ncbi:MAG: polysaccharide biosynthesis C-terminal domain-containing protein [Fluviicola sp.]|nr:polysaccharide biosynthesis C-terminal domain-containing protein [Fluviicola sp.]
MSVIATDLLMRLVVTGAIILYAFGTIDFFTLLVLHSMSFVLPTLVITLQMFRNKELHLKISDISIPRRFKKILLTYSLFSYFNFIGILLVLSLDVIMVASMVGLAETGVFSTIVYIVSGLLVPYKSLLRISAPFVAKYWKERNMVEMKDLYTRISSISLVIGFFVFLVFWENRTELFHFLRESFHEGIPVFLILMIGRLVDMYCGINGAIFITSKKYKYDLIFTAILLVSVVGLNFIFIPLYGMYGAALSTTIAYVLYNLARLIFVFSVYNLHPFKKGHLYVMAVFFLSLLMMEQLPVFFGNELISIVLKGILVLVTFILPIYLLKLDADVVGYLDKIRNKFLPSAIRNS